MNTGNLLKPVKSKITSYFVARTSWLNFFDGILEWELTWHSEIGWTAQHPGGWVELMTPPLPPPPKKKKTPRDRLLEKPPGKYCLRKATWGLGLPVRYSNRMLLVFLVSLILCVVIFNVMLTSFFYVFFKEFINKRYTRTNAEWKFK